MSTYKINLPLLQQMIDEGFVVAQKHPDLDIYIYNYTRKCTFEKMWNEVTMRCRGLILDSNGNIVSLPLPKFFNWEELSPEKQESLLKLDYSLYSKADGSCGILWEYQGNYGIATRGSFASDQSVWATKLLHEKYLNAVKKIDLNKYTLVFEIIADFNRIVCSYAEEDIILLATINKETGCDELWNDKNDIISNIDKNKYFRTIDNYDHLKHLSLNELKALDWENHEGFVLHFSNNERVKLKFPNYCRLHSIITNITSRDIWEALKENKDISDILENVPDEFDAWVNNKIQQLQSDFNIFYLKCVSAREQVKLHLNNGYTRQEFAAINLELNKKRGLASFVFALEDGKKTADKSFSDAIWDKICPAFEKPFANNEDL